MKIEHYEAKHNKKNLTGKPINYLGHNLLPIRPKVMEIECNVVLQKFTEI